MKGLDRLCPTPRLICYDIVRYFEFLTKRTTFIVRAIHVPCHFDSDSRYVPTV